MAYQFPLSYYYVTEQDDKRLEKFSEASGDSRQTLIMQYVRGWLGRHRLYYVALSRLDIAHRQINEDQWVETVVNQGFDALPEYKTPIVDGEIPPNPLAHIVLPGNMVRRDINYIALTKQNYLLLRTAIYFDTSKIAQYISKIIYEQLARNWDNLYAAQVAAENSNDWLRGE
ncbi:MAG: transposase [Komarekiella atlantica HA4396-MV6]|jgi:hypothetical protein|nr:transposase [Komarekiella atlantica HA4396-MV6]